MDPGLDDRRKWARDYKVVDNNKSTNKRDDIFVFFRPSQVVIDFFSFTSLIYSFYNKTLFQTG